MTNDLVDVIAVSFFACAVLWVEPRKARDNAEAIIKMAIMRQGLDDRFFTTCRCGRFKTGDKYSPGSEVER